MNLRVLIVEDEKALAEILEYNFKKEGYVVDTASDGEIALDKIIFKVSAGTATTPTYLIIAMEFSLQNIANP